MQGWRAEMEDVHLSLARLFDPCDSPAPFQPPKSQRGRGIAPASSSPLKPSAGSPDGKLFCSSPLSFFGVFDGHGGSVVPAYIGATLPTELSRELSKRSRDAFIAEKRQEASTNAKGRLFVRQKKAGAQAAAAVRDDVGIPQFLSRALRNSFVETDWKAIDAIPNDALTSGSTCVTAVIVGAERPKVVSKKQTFAPDGTLIADEELAAAAPPLDPAVAKTMPIFGNTNRGAWGLLWVANSGDSRAVLCRNGEAVAMSDDHKPWLESEMARIYTAGHNVTNNRIDGGINLSRGIGDWRYKGKTMKPEQCAVTCVPDVRRRTLARTDEFLVLGCDGIWDRMTSQQMCNFIRLRLMPRSHWSDDELSVDQGVNSKLYDPYAEYDAAVAKCLADKEALKSAPSKSKAHHSKKKSLEANKEPMMIEEPSDGKAAGIPITLSSPTLEDDDLDEMTRHHKEILERVCEPREVFEKYKLWPGDPGVCSSVEELLTTIARHVCNNCLNAESEATAYGTDNMTVTIVLFPNSSLGRQVCKRYPKLEPLAPQAVETVRRRGRSSQSTGDEDGDSTGEFDGSSSGTPGAAAVVKPRATVFTSVKKDSRRSHSQDLETAPKKRKKHSRHRPKVDLTAPMSDAEKMVYQFADEFSDDDIYVIAPPMPDGVSF